MKTPTTKVSFALTIKVTNMAGRMEVEIGFDQ